MFWQAGSRWLRNAWYRWAVDPSPLLAPRLLLVTGKGGVGKSTVAASLALAAVRSGRRTCLVEVEGRQTFSRLFDTSPWGFEEREFRPGLFGMSVDPEASLAEYLDLFYGAKRISKLVVGSTAVEFATTAAPGIKDVLLIGKVKEMERRRDADGHFAYDCIVVDAPPTGRIVNFLRAPEAATALVNVGPIRTQAQSVVDMITDGARTHVQLVTLLEDMPVQETIESIAALTELGVRLNPVIANRVIPDPFDAQARKALKAGLEDLAAILGDAGLPVDEETAQALRALGMGRLTRLELQKRSRKRLVEEGGMPVVELPQLSAGPSRPETFGTEQIASLATTIEGLA